MFVVTYKRYRLWQCAAVKTNTKKTLRLISIHPAKLKYVRELISEPPQK